MTYLAKQLVATITKNYKGSGADIVLSAIIRQADGSTEFDIDVQDGGETVDAFNFTTDANGEILWAPLNAKLGTEGNIDEATRRFGRYLRDAKIVGFDQAFAGVFNR
jgi:hypothetical protein